MDYVDRLTAKAQVGLAFFYGISFLAMFLVLVYFWQTLSKVDVGLLTMFATGALSQAKDSSSYFFARHRTSGIADPQGADSNPTQPPQAAK